MGGLCGWGGGLPGGGWPAQGSKMRKGAKWCASPSLAPALQNEPWELDHPMLARTLVDAFRADTDPAPNEEDDQSGNGGRGDSARAARTAARAAARAAAAAARALYNQVVTSRLMTTGPASRENGQRSASSSRSSQGPGNGEMAPATSSGAPATSSQPQPASQAREAASSRAAGASEGGATQPKKPFLGQNDGFDFTQPAGVSGLAFPRPKRPAPAPEPASEGPSAQAASAGEGAATRPKTAKSGKAVAKTRWVEPQNVVAAAAAKAKMATSAPEPEGAAATAQKNRDEARKGGKRTKKVRSPCKPQWPPPLLFCALPSAPLPSPLLPSPLLPSPALPSPPSPPLPCPLLLSTRPSFCNTSALACLYSFTRSPYPPAWRYKRLARCRALSEPSAHATRRSYYSHVQVRALEKMLPGAWAQ